jgi:hypothetical protein
MGLHLRKRLSFALSYGAQRLDASFNLGQPFTVLGFRLSLGEMCRQRETRFPADAVKAFVFFPNVLWDAFASDILA